MQSERPSAQSKYQSISLCLAATGDSHPSVSSLGYSQGVLACLTFTVSSQDSSLLVFTILLSPYLEDKLPYPEHLSSYLNNMSKR